MADLRIVDAPVLLQESITDDVKMPTGGLGNFSVRLGDILWYVITKEQLANKNYVDLSSKSVKDSLDVHIADRANPHNVTKAQVGLGNVDNTADVDKPISNATKSAIITATTDMATKAYVNQQDNLKADITYVDSKDGDLTALSTTDKTSLVKAINEVVSVKADKATTLVGYGISDAYTKSEIDTNYGGVKTLYDKNVEAGAGVNGWADTLIAVSENINQRQINDGLESIAQLLSIKNPRNGQRVPVKSHHEGFGVGGGWFYFVKDSTEAPIQGLIVAGQGGVWKRETKPFYLVEDFGCHESKDANINAIALKACFDNVKNIVATKTYSVEILNAPMAMTSGSILTGGGTFIGTAPDTVNADGRGVMIRLSDVNNIKIYDVTLKNGYMGSGIFATNTHALTIDNVTVDGFTYGIWAGESTALKGCTNVRINNVRIKNTRYWGIYIRCLDVVIEKDMTYDVVCSNSYFYNCHGAGFVCSEGYVNNVVLENSYFEDCNVGMHFESTNRYRVVNVTTKNTAKKPTHVNSPEYPFKAMSVYQAFSSDAEFINCNFDKHIYVGCVGEYKARNYKYTNVTCSYVTFEAWADTGTTGVTDTNKDYFKNFVFDKCTFTGMGFYYQSNAVNHWLRDFKVVNCMFLDGEGQAATATRIAMNFAKFVNLEVSNNNFKNTSVVLTGEGTLKFNDNIFKNTDGRSLYFTGPGSSVSSGGYLEVVGNTFEKVGAGYTEAAIYISGWTRARVDNLARCYQTATCYKFTNNYRLEIGGGLVFDITTANSFTESNTSSLIYLYHKPA